LVWHQFFQKNSATVLILSIFTDFLHQYLGPDLGAAFFIVLNLILIESLLSIDNAAVLATLVMDLPPTQRSRALRIGLILSYVFRGLCLLFASYLIKISWLKFAGGAYLVYLSLHYFTSQHKHEDVDGIKKRKRGKVFRYLEAKFGLFLTTVLMVETMDLAFSIDNVFAAVAFTDNIYLVIFGVFIGILTMRLVATLFVKLLNKYPHLSTSAFVVIGLLGAKLVLSFLCPYFQSQFCAVLESEKADLVFSVFTVCIFLVPLLFSKQRNQEVI